MPLPGRESLAAAARSQPVFGRRKRPVHRLNSWLIRRKGATIFAGGTPGAQWQVQTNVQMTTNLIGFADPGRTIKLEWRAGEATFAGRRERGHSVHAIGPWEAGGAAQVRRPGCTVLGA
jgi:gamma-glutamyltranspeptidase/glutathione hydrolase